MTLKHLPINMLRALDLLPAPDVPVTLFTRHSIRELVDGRGLAGYDLPLTEDGRELALSWGDYLIRRTERRIEHCISSPIQRCIDTASLMIEGADRANNFTNTHQIEIVEQGLLVEPGSFVVDIQQAAPHFKIQGARGFINSFVNNRLPGMKHPIHGVRDVLQLLHQFHAKGHAGLSLAVSHDTILAGIVAVLTHQKHIQAHDWPQMMEGLFMWFEGDAFHESRLSYIWRGQLQHLGLTDLQAASQAQQDDASPALESFQSVDGQVVEHQVSHQSHHQTNTDLADNSQETDTKDH